jgi:drug/metabolite transporter (DMT)-like permease
VVIWGTTWAAIRVGLDDVPPFTGVALRFALAAAVLAVLAAAMRVRLLAGPLERRMWLVHGVFTFTLSYTVTYWAEQFVPSGLASVLFATFPLFVALLAHRFLPGERLGGMARVGVLVGFLGVAVIFSEDFSSLGGRQVLVGSLVMLLSPIAAAIGNVAVKRWGSAIHPLSLNVGGMSLTAVLVGVLAALVERDRTVVFSAPAVGSILYLAIFGSAVTFSLYFWLLRFMTATRLSLIAYVIPVVAVAVGTTMLDEPLTVRIVLGAGLVLSGVGLASRK